MTDQADMEALIRARELGIMDRVLTDAENAIYDAGMAAAYDSAAEVAYFECAQTRHVRLGDQCRAAILSLKEGKG